MAVASPFLPHLGVKFHSNWGELKLATCRADDGLVVMPKLLRQLFANAAIAASRVPIAPSSPLPCPKNEADNR
jgi:hypothetical protein